MAVGLLKPILQEPGNFNAENTMRLGVSILGYETFSYIRISVFNYENSLLVWSGTQNYEDSKYPGTDDFFATIPANSLANGVRYYANVQITKNVADTQLKFLSSPVSNNVQFTCFAPDKMEITAITTPVTTSNVKISFKYAQNYNFPLETLSFELWKKTGSGETDFSAGKRKSNVFYINSSDFEYNFVFTDLDPNSSYQVIASALLYGYKNETVTTMNFSTGDFESPSGILAVTSQECKGAKITYTKSTSESFTGIEWVVLKTKNSSDNWGDDWRIVKKISPSSISNVSTVIDYMSDVRNQVIYAVVFQYSDGTESGRLIATSYIPTQGKMVLSDREKGYSFVYSLGYDNTTLNQNVGMYVPYSQQYPVFISNGKNKYKTGGFTAKILTKELLDQVTATGTQNSGAYNIRKLTDEFLAWLTDKQNSVKILKDGNGNYLMVRFNDNPSISYDNSFGQQIITVSASWTECGDIDNQKDWIKNKLADEPVKIITT